MSLQSQLDQTALLPRYLSLYAYKGRSFTPFQPSVSWSADVLEEICDKESLGCSLDLFFANKNSYIFTNFSDLFHCGVTAQGIQFSLLGLEPWSNIKRCKCIRWYFEEWVDGLSGWNLSSPSPQSECCNGWGANCAKTGPNRILQGISDWEMCWRERKRSG